MCTVSMVSGGWPTQYPNWVPQEPYQFPYTAPYIEQKPTEKDLSVLFKRDVSRDEFEALKKELQELRKLLVAAKAYDEATGQKDCEQADKVKLFRTLADLVGVDLKDVFPT